MLFGYTAVVNYWDRMITNYIREHCGEVQVPSSHAPNSYFGEFRMDEILLMYAMHDIKIDTYSIDNQRVDNLLTAIRDYTVEKPNSNVRIIFVREQTDFIDSWFDGTEGNFTSNPAIDVIVKQTEDALNKYEYRANDLRIRVGFLENNMIIMSNRNLDRYRYAHNLLAFALLPMQYEAIKEQMTEKELTLCKQMIRYTQLSRKPKQDLLHAIIDVESQEYIQKIIKELEKEQYFILLKDSITEAPRNRLASAERQFNDAKSTYQQALESLKRSQREYFAATMEENDDIIDGIKTFLKNPNIIDIRRDNNRLYITVKTPLDIYDPDYVECILRNLNDNDNFKRLWKGLYEEDNGYFISSSVYCLNLIGDDYRNRITVMRDYPYQDERREYKVGFNPHHYFFNCLGQFEVTINEAIKDNNFMILGDLLATSTRSINLADTAVLNRFKDFLNNYPQYYYVMYKEEVMTASEALAKMEVANEEDTN